MSRLDSAIRRLQAQRACINRGIEIVGERPGLVLEIGLGNGRTFDHLRTLVPERQIYVFERNLLAHSECLPKDEFLVKGDFLQTLPEFKKQIAQPIILAHCDVGSGDKVQSLRRASKLAQILTSVVAPGGIIVSDQEMREKALSALPLPQEVESGRYYLFSVT